MIEHAWGFPQSASLTTPKSCLSQSRLTSWVMYGTLIDPSPNLAKSVTKEFNDILDNVFWGLLTNTAKYKLFFLRNSSLETNIFGLKNKKTVVYGRIIL